MNNLSANIRSRLRDFGMTQKELAERVSVSTVMVHKLLSGKSSSTSTNLDFASVLECDPNWLKTQSRIKSEWLGGIDAWDS